MIKVMSNLMINDELHMVYPDSFHVMDEKEKESLNTLTGDDFVGISDPEAHMMVTVGYKANTGFAAKLLSAKDIAKNMEKQISKPMMIYSYARGRFNEIQIGGIDASGFDYSYEVQGIVMFGESYVIKKDKTVYYFSMYSRDNMKTKNLSTWEDMIRQARWE